MADELFPHTVPPPNFDPDPSPYPYPSLSPQGEFYYVPILPLVLEGGHAVTVVGYNDLFVTEAGFTGGWIIKNSWWDGLPPAAHMWNHARGSHTLGYFLQVSTLVSHAIPPFPTFPSLSPPHPLLVLTGAFRCRRALHLPECALAALVVRLHRLAVLPQARDASIRKHSPQSERRTSDSMCYLLPAACCLLPAACCCCCLHSRVPFCLHPLPS